MTIATTVTTILVAVLGGSAAGAVIQGMTGYLASLRRRRGASRLMRDIAYRQQVLLQRAAREGHWWYASEVPPAMGSDDVMIVAASLPGQQWSGVTKGIRLFDHLEAKRLFSKKPDRNELRKAFDQLDAARKSLAMAEPKSMRWHYSTFQEDWPKIDRSRSLRR